jgi:hypothetical protein
VSILFKKKIQHKKNPRGGRGFLAKFTIGLIM